MINSDSGGFSALDSVFSQAGYREFYERNLGIYWPRPGFRQALSSSISTAVSRLFDQGRTVTAL